MTAAVDTAPVTPTGALVYDGDPHTDEWFAARRRGITATDVPKILGLSEYGTARHVWLDKQGLAPVDEGSEAARWGTLLEDIVAREWAARVGSEVVPVGILANRDEPWKLASLDRIVLDCPEGFGPCGLEVKTRSAFVAGKWRDDIPDDVLAQVQWGLAVTGYQHMHVAALIGGQRMSDYLVTRDDDIIAYLVEAAEKLWGQVQSGEMPECPPTAALGRLLNALHAVRDGDVVVSAATADALRAEYLNACTEVKAAEDRKERAKVLVLDALGGGERLCAAEGDATRAVFTYAARSKTSITLGKVRADPAAWAAVQAAGAVKVSSYRQITCHQSEGETP